MNTIRIHRLLERKRAAHPELQRSRIGMRELRAVAQREGIIFYFTQMSGLGGMASEFMGEFVISLDSNLPPRRHPEVLAHELAHVWLHLSGPGPGHFTGTWQVRRGTSSSPRWVRRDLEADYLAGLLCAGS